MCVWPVDEGKEPVPLRLRLHSAPVQALTYVATSDQLVSLDTLGKLVVWDMSAERKLVCVCVSVCACVCVCLCARMILKCRMRPLFVPDLRAFLAREFAPSKFQRTAGHGLGSLTSFSPCKYRRKLNKTMHAFVLLWLHRPRGGKRATCASCAPSPFSGTCRSHPCRCGDKESRALPTAVCALPQPVHLLSVKMTHS